MKYCATSLESMIEFSTSKMGKNVIVLPTEIIRHNKEESTQQINDEKMIKQQDYTITSGVKKMVGVFYCHATHTKAYVVPLIGNDDSATKVEVVAVCHTDTSAWNPKHLAFQLLNVKPGTVPICHFLSKDNIVWVAKNYGYY
ncbi:BURP domain [Macleaya cordata]|uniref:BURP domain n=1 Tax=Macleaya cordata TaxID=56857 RepID=A0A200PP07_MACCD|nr:BURP domain [Macleaya cordata]